MEEQFEKEYQLVPIGNLHESPSNPRKKWDAQKQKELADSIQLKGVLEPLLVRRMPKDGGYEVVSGGRRLRAAQAIGLKLVPVLVRDYKDEEVREIQLIENLQREDMEPIDEAAAYDELIRSGLTVETIAERIGKNPTYVYRRLRLVSLIPEAKGLLGKEKLGLMLALELCRLQPGNQKEALEWIEKNDYSISTNQLREWIETNFFLDLNSAPFKKKDPELVKEAGACTECPKRTGFVPMLFPDIKKKDLCTDPTCFQLKVKTYIEQEIKDKGDVLRISDEWNYYGKSKDKPKDVIFRDNYRLVMEKEKPCGYQREAIIVSGQGLGQWRTVCVDPSCKMHHGKMGILQKTPEQKEEAKKERIDQKIKNTSRIRLLEEVKKVVPVPLEGEVLLAVVHKTFSRLWHEHKKRLANHLGWEIKKEGYSLDFDGAMAKEVDKMNDKDRYRFLLEITFISDTETIPMDATRDNTALGNIARLLNISPKEIEKETRRVLESKGKEKKPTEPKEEKKAKKEKAKKKGGKS